MKDDAYRPFVPQRGRLVAWAAAAACVLVFGLVSFVLVPTGGATGWTTVDQWALFALGIALGWALSRWALVRAVPTQDGLKVRNLILTQFVPWARIVDVQFGGGKPWCVLDLDDTEQLAIMGIQRSDGPRAEEEARRLAALVSVHNRRER